MILRDFRTLLMPCLLMLTSVVANGDNHRPSPLPLKPNDNGNEFMVSATSPYVTAAGYNVLQTGGNAVDAMVAMQMMMSVVEPDMTGLGGGTFALFYNRQEKTVQALDGRETAPLSAFPEMFLKANGLAITRNEILGPRSVAIPGTLKLLYETHQKNGSKLWKELLKPAIAFAESGFVLSSFTHGILDREQRRLKEDPAMRKIFWDEKGDLKPAGSVVKNPELAKTLKLIAIEGDKPFYQGELAEAIIQHVNKLIPEGYSKLSVNDFRHYKIKYREPVRAQYKNYTITGFGYPASGSMMVVQTLKMLEPFQLDKYQPSNPEAWRLQTEAMRIAQADRRHYAGDPDYVDIPIEKMLNGVYLKHRAQRIPAKGVMSIEPEAGKLLKQEPGLDDGEEGQHTSHISIVDSEGNAIAMTSTIGTGMGSGIMVKGIVLNAQMVNFAATPKANGRLVYNRIEAGKRPRSAMTPLMLFNPDSSLRLVVGSPGSAQIPGYVIKTIIGVVDWGLSAQNAIDLPNIQYGTKIDRTKPQNPYGLLVEKNTFAEMLVPAFTRYGYDVELIPMVSGLNAVEVTKTGLSGAADRRRGAASLGD